MAVSAALIGLIAASVIGSLGAAGISAWSANENKNSQERINDANIQAQKDINSQNVINQQAINQQNIDYSREYAQNSIQWRMDDLEAAGLNPTLAAGSGSGATPPTLSSANQRAATQQAPFFDMNGVANALTALNNTMLTAYLMQGRNDIQADRNEVLREKNDVLDSLYKRKGLALGNSLTGNAKQVQKAIMTAEDDKKWSEFMKEFKKIDKAWRNNKFF